MWYFHCAPHLDVAGAGCCEVLLQDAKLRGLFWRGCSVTPQSHWMSNSMQWCNWNSRWYAPVAVCVCVQSVCKYVYFKHMWTLTCENNRVEICFIVRSALTMLNWTNWVPNVHLCAAKVNQLSQKFPKSTWVLLMTGIVFIPVHDVMVHNIFLCVKRLKGYYSS